MATTTTRLQLRKPDPNPTTGDFVDVVQDINDSMDKIDAAMSTTICTSGTRPTGSDRWDGREIWETDTRRRYMWSQTLSIWVPILMSRGTNGPYQLGTSTDTSGEGINVETGSAGTNILRTRIVADSQPRFVINTDGFLAWGPGSGSVDVGLGRTGTAEIGTSTGHAFRVSGDLICGSENGVSQAATSSGTNTQASSSYANMAGTGSATSFSFVKRFTSTKIRIDLSATFYTSTAGCGARFGVLINSVDYDICQLAGNVPAAVTHLLSAGFAYVASGLAAGTYTVQGRWKTLGTAGTLTRDNNDWLSISAREC